MNFCQLFQRQVGLARPAVHTLCLVLLWGCCGCRNLLVSSPPMDDAHSASRQPQAISSSHAHAAAEHTSPTQLASWAQRLQVFQQNRKLPGTPMEEVAGWFPAPAAEVAAAEQYRWRHPVLDELLSEASEGADESRRGLRVAQRSSSRLGSATATIALARLEGDRHAEALAALVRDRSLPLTLRRAAAETLGHVAPPQLLYDLIAPLAASSQLSASSIGLHAELLRALGRHANWQSYGFLEAALHSQHAELQIAALQSWSELPDVALPRAAVELIGHPDKPLVRVAALQAAGRRRATESLEAVRSALSDADFSVRLAAIEALGRLGGEAARRDLEALLVSGGEPIRVAVVAAMAQMGNWQAVYRAGGDTSWRVRKAAAQTLRGNTSGEAQALLGQLLQDVSPEVQLYAVRSIAALPPPMAGPLLLAACQSPNYRSRKEAIQQLAAFWPPAGKLPAQGPTRDRQSQWSQLVRQWHAEFGATAVPNHLPLPLGEAQGEGLLQPLPHQHALASASNREEAEQALLHHLASSDSRQRRHAAAQFEASSPQTKSPAAWLALAAHLVDESDAKVWQSAFWAWQSHSRPVPEAILRTALRHPSAQVRQLACQYLKTHDAARYVRQLAQLLDDPDPQVQRAAIQAYGLSGTLSDPAPLKRLLEATDVETQIAAAVALSRIGSASGPAALERFSLDPDDALRRRAASAMGQLRDPQLLPALIRLLRDKPSIRRAALLALPQIVGHDVSLQADPPPHTPQQRATCWINWFDSGRRTEAVQATQGSEDADSSTIVDPKAS